MTPSVPATSGCVVLIRESRRRSAPLSETLDTS